MFHDPQVPFGFLVSDDPDPNGRNILGSGTGVIDTSNSQAGWQEIPRLSTQDAGQRLGLGRLGLAEARGLGRYLPSLGGVTLHGKKA